MEAQPTPWRPPTALTLPAWKAAPRDAGRSRGHRYAHPVSRGFRKIERAVLDLVREPFYRAPDGVARA